MTKNYKLLWLSFFVSNLGDWLRKIALPLIVLEKTGSAFHMATLYGISFIPWIVFSIVGGVIADKYKKNKVIAYSHFISLVVLFILILEFSKSNINLFFIYVLTFLLSSTEPIVHPSFQSLLPQTVETKNLSSANAKIQLIDNTLNLIGPMISGSVILLLQPIKVLWINVFTLLIAGLLILLITGVDNHIINKEKESVGKTIAIGLNYVKENKVILSGSILFLFTNFGIHMLQANFIYYITSILGYSTWNYGLILSMAGCGAIIGAFIAPVLNERFTTGSIIAMSTIMAGIFTIVLAFNTNYISIGIFLGLANMCGNINVISYFSLRHRVVPKELLGRVISITRMISFISIPLGAYIGGVLLTKDVSIMKIIIAGVIRLTAGIFGYISPLNKTASKG